MIRGTRILILSVSPDIHSTLIMLITLEVLRIANFKELYIPFFITTCHDTET